MKLKVKLLNALAKLPTKSHATDAGFDLYMTSVVNGGLFTTYKTGIAVEIPSGHVGLLFSRSSVTNFGQILGNGVGVIDENYRGEVQLRFYDLTRCSSKIQDGVHDNQLNPYKVGDRIGQLVILKLPNIEIEQSDELSSTDRGVGGFGSSGK